MANWILLIQNIIYNIILLISRCNNNRDIVTGGTNALVWIYEISQLLGMKMKMYEYTYTHSS